MDTCGKCGRILAANGRCNYCGTIDLAPPAPVSRRGSTAVLWLRWLVKVALAGGLLYGAYVVYFTDEGRRWVESIRAKFGASEPEFDEAIAPWVKPLLEYPKLKELLKDGVHKDLQIELDPPGSSEDPKLVVIIRRDGPELRQAAFRVYSSDGFVEPQDAWAQELTAP